MKRRVALTFIFCILSAFYVSAQKVHFSIDDVGASLKDLTENEKEYGSLFDQKFFKYLKQLNERHGAKVTLYCFYEFNGFQLADCTEKFKDEFSSNADWLKFGYHAYNASQTFIDGRGVSDVC